MIVQVARGKYSVRLEVLGLDFGKSEKAVLSSMLLWILGFLMACKNLGKSAKKNVYVSASIDLLRVAIRGSNLLLDSIMKDGLEP